MMDKLIMLSGVIKRGGGEERVGVVRAKFCSICIELKLTATQWQEVSERWNAIFCLDISLYLRPILRNGM